MQPPVKRAIISFLKSSKPGKILDIPCGDGWLKNELIGKGWDYHGADLFTSPDIKAFTVGDLNKELPFEDQSYDYIVCFEGLEHIENYHLAIREFHRILKEDGQLLISTPNILNVKSRKRFYYYGTYYGFPHLFEMPAEGEHCHINPINPSFLLSFAEKYGFKLNSIHPIEIKPKMYRFLISCLVIKFYAFIKTINKDKKIKDFIRQLTTVNVLLNDGIFVSFKKTG